MGVASRRCRQPHPTERWQAGREEEPYRCVEPDGHPPPHRAVCAVSDVNPTGIPMLWR